MTHNFCTYFDKNYLIKGLSLYRSLSRNCADFKLWILCLDYETFEILGKLKLEQVVLIKLSELEGADQEFFAVKDTRTIVEYFWTSTPCLPLYIFKKNPSLETISYIDADLFFFNTPEEIYKEFGDKSILIIPHRFIDKKKARWEKNSGIFNVGLLIFRNDQKGKKCLLWWREKCLKSCTLDPDAGLCGDQKYLDEFSSRFSGVHVLSNIGANVATWNIENYKVSQRNTQTFVNGTKLIFFHFASFKLYPQSKYSFFDYGGPASVFPYDKISEAGRYIYEPYARALYSSLAEVRNIIPAFNNGVADRPSVFEPSKNFGMKCLKKVLHFFQKIHP